VAGDPYLEGNSRWTNQSFVLRIRAGKGGYISHEIVAVRIEESGRPVPMTGEQAAPLMARQERISRELSDPAALERAWAETSRRWWRTNIEWLASAAKEKGPEYAARHFLQEFFYDENNPWVRRMIGEVLRGMPRRAWEQPHGRGQGIGCREQSTTTAGPRDAGRGSNGNGQIDRNNGSATSVGRQRLDSSGQAGRSAQELSHGPRNDNNGHSYGKVHRRGAEGAENNRETRNNDHKDTAQAEAWTPNLGNGDNGQIGGRKIRSLPADASVDTGDSSAQAAGE
jgi:hypothetical protein